MSVSTSRCGARTPRLRGDELALLILCLLLSGAAALIYELLWLRQLSLVMGHTVHSLAAMLTAFLGGLALGAWLGGRLTQRGLVGFRLYAGIELAIAGAALAMPLAIASLAPLFRAAYNGLGERFLAYQLVQFVACGLVLLVPTTLMGATLPLVTSLALGGRPGFARGAGGLYAANSAGGVLGAALAGFLLIPALGMWRTGFTAAALNVVVALLAIWLALRVRGRAAAETARREKSPRRTGAASPGAWPAPAPGLVGPLYAAAGFAALTLEVGWARVVSLSVGSTTYGFTLILVTYISGLAVGSWLVPRFRQATGNPVRAVFALNLVVALWSLLSLPYLGSLPLRIVEVFGAETVGFGSLIFAEWLLVGATIAVPTVAMGGTFPLVAHLFRGRLPEGGEGRAVGSTYGAGTLGNILGSFTAGFLLVPTLGMRLAIVVAACLHALVALAFAAPGLVRGRRPILYAAAGGVVAVAAALGSTGGGWDREVLTSGPYLYGPLLQERARRISGPHAIARAIRERGELVDYREGATSVVSVKRAPSGGLRLQVGGKSDAFDFASTQNFIAHLPLLLHGEARDVLIVGLGGGATLGSALAHPVRQVDCVEISPEVLEMARKHFSASSNHALDDSRARVMIGDGRNHLRHTRATYDVIVSQPSNPWISGAAGLFTQQYFEDVRDHLRPGGIACSWFKFDADDGRGMKSVLASWHRVFEHAYFFESRLLGEHLLIGLREGGRLAAAPVARGLARPSVARDLARIAILDVADLFGYLFFGAEGIAAYSGGAPINTDDNAYLEFGIPKVLHDRDRLARFDEISRLRQDPRQLVDLQLDSATATARLDRRLEAIYRSKRLVLEARLTGEREGRSEAWRRLILEAAELNPRDPYVARSLRDDRK